MVNFGDINNQMDLDAIMDDITEATIKGTSPSRNMSKEIHNTGAELVDEA